MNVKQTREHMDMLKRLAELEEKVVELERRITAKRGPGRPKKAVNVG